MFVALNIESRNRKKINSQQTVQQVKNVDNKISFGLHHEQIKHTDYVSESIKEKIGSGEYVNMVYLLIPEYEQMKEKKDHYSNAIELKSSLWLLLGSIIKNTALSHKIASGSDQ